MHDLVVVLDPELTFSHHINLVARKCKLHQLRVVSRSLTHQKTLTRIHSFVTSRIDCCSSPLAGSPLGTLAWLDRVLRSVSLLAGRLPRFSAITTYISDVLHWLQYRIAILVSCCVFHCTPSYLCDLCCPVLVWAVHRVLHLQWGGELFGPSDPVSYYAAKGLFGCGSISMEWSPHWAAILAEGLPFQILHISKVFLLWPWLGQQNTSRTFQYLFQR